MARKKTLTRLKRDAQDKHEKRNIRRGTLLGVVTGSEGQSRLDSPRQWVNHCDDGAVSSDFAQIKLGYRRSSVFDGHRELSRAKNYSVRGNTTRAKRKPKTQSGNVISNIMALKLIEAAKT